MKIRVIVTKVLDDLWGTEEELAEFSDGEIIEVIQEDLCAFIDEADWKVERTN